MMETLLNEDAGLIMKAINELYLNGLHLDTVDDINGKKEGGIAIVYKDSIKQKIQHMSVQLLLVWGLEIRYN